MDNSINSWSYQDRQVLMTRTQEINISWLHCNDCHRAFENHNRVEQLSDGRLQVIKSDLGFSFTGCGHFFCDNCIQLASTLPNTSCFVDQLSDHVGDTGKFVCKVCNEASSRYKVEGRIAKNLEMYIKPPISMLEDSVSVMMFQLNNANQLIRSLRSKVSQQKELITKAKQELTSHKSLKERVLELQKENELLKNKINNFISDSQDFQKKQVEEKTPIVRPPASPSIPNIKAQGRLSLKSPIICTPPSLKRSSNLQYNHHGLVPQTPQTPASEMWNPPFRNRPDIQNNFNPIHSYANQSTPVQYSSYPNSHPPQRQQQQQHPLIQQPNHLYNQNQSDHPFYSSIQSFGSPRPYERKPYPTQPSFPAPYYPNH